MNTTTAHAQSGHIGHDAGGNSSKVNIFPRDETALGEAQHKGGGQDELMDSFLGGGIGAGTGVAAGGETSGDGPELVAGRHDADLKTPIAGVPNVGVIPRVGQTIST